MAPRTIAFRPSPSLPSLPAVAALALGAGLLGSGPELQAQELEGERLSLEHHLEWERIQSPQVSPDGEQIIHTRTFRDPVEDGWDSELWIMNADGSRHRFLTEGSSPQWSPDGERIAYLAEGKPEGTQVFVRWMDDEGAESQVTRMEEAPSNIRWSPDGERLAFQARVPEGPDPMFAIDMPERPAGAEWAEDPDIVDRPNYRADGVGLFPPGHQHLFVVSADGGSPRQVTEGDYDHTSAEWTPDGERLVFQSLREEDADRAWRQQEIYDVEVATGEVRRLTDVPGPHGNPLPSPDGEHIAFTGHDFTEDTFYENELYVMDADGGAIRELAAELDRAPMSLHWDPAGEGIYLTAEKDGHRHVFHAPLAGGYQQVTDGEHVLHMHSLAADGTGAGTLATAHDPGSLVRIDPAGAAGGAREPEILKSSNADLLADVQLGDVEEIWYESFDGWDIQGWIVKPPDFDPDQEYPLILAIHGGPHIMWDVAFDFAWHEHAANGYVVLYTNPRGSSGYGSEFGNAIDNDYPGDDYHDLMAGVDAILERGYIDEDNLFVYGGSGGGVLTAWIVGNTDRFTAAVSKAPVINWMSFVGTTDGYTWYNNFEDFPWDDPSEHLERSPLMNAGDVETPTAFITHERDLRTPISQTEEMYMALQMEEVPTAMIRMKEGWHNRREPPSNFYRVQLHLRNWFEEFMVGETPATADGDGR